MQSEPMTAADLDKLETLLKAAKADSGFSKAATWAVAYGPALISELRASRAEKAPTP